MERILVPELTDKEPRCIKDGTTDMKHVRDEFAVLERCFE